MKIDNDKYRAICTGHFWDAFGPEGIAVLSYWYGTHFVNALTDEWGLFPLMHVHGNAGTGREALAEFLWKLAGHSDYSASRPLILDSQPASRALGDNDADAQNADRWCWIGSLFSMPGQPSLVSHLQSRLVTVELSHRSRIACKEIEQATVRDLCGFAGDVERTAGTATSFILRRAKVHWNWLFSTYRMRDAVLLDTYARTITMVEALTFLLPLNAGQLATTKNLLAQAARQQEHRLPDRNAVDASAHGGR